MHNVLATKDEGNCKMNTSIKKKVTAQIDPDRARWKVRGGHGEGGGESWERKGVYQIAMSLKL